jgi:hypothetical protein
LLAIFLLLLMSRSSCVIWRTQYYLYSILPCFCMHLFCLLDSVLKSPTWLELAFTGWSS